MDIALCYQSVLPTRGGCEQYISDLARRLARDGHAVHLYACRWDPAALPVAMHYHRLPLPKGPRFLKPWQFARSCEEALKQQRHDVSMGFDKTWGQDILYPLGGLHAASAANNLLKHPPGLTRGIARILKAIDPASFSFRLLERKQYLSKKSPMVAVNSHMVQRHFEEYYGIPPENVHVVPCAIDPGRFRADDRPKRRVEERERWGIASDVPVGLFAAMNSQLKGLSPLIHSLAYVPQNRRFCLAVIGSKDSARYERLAQRLGVGDRVKFLGFRTDSRDAFFASDFLVHPTFYDPCSLVVLEALCCGLPVITTRYNGASELISPPNEGLVIDDPHDHRSLAAAVATMLDPATRSACAAAARQTARRWSFEQHYQQLMHLFRQVAGLKQAA